MTRQGGSESSGHRTLFILEKLRCEGLNTEKPSSALQFSARPMFSGGIFTGNIFSGVEMRCDVRKIC